MTLLQYINKYYDKDFKAADMPFEVTRKEIKKGSIIFPYNKIGAKIYFINEGIIESTTYFDGVEKITAFTFAGNFEAPLSSALTGEPSIAQGKALIDCVVEEFNYQDYLDACDNLFLFNKIGRIEIGKSYLEKIQRERDLSTKNTEEMYLDLLKMYPQLLQEVPLYKIANYLGVVPETLSRIRKKITS